MSRRQAPNTEELWRCLWADTGAQLAAEGVSREDLQQLLCIPGQGVMHLVVLLREDAGMGGEVLRAAVRALGRRTRSGAPSRQCQWLQPQEGSDHGESSSKSRPNSGELLWLQRGSWECWGQSWLPCTSHPRVSFESPEQSH